MDEIRDLRNIISSIEDYFNKPKPRRAMATRNTLDAKERKRLIDEIQSTGNQLIARGINAKFVKRKDIPIEDLSLYDLCVALIDEARRCTAQGINCAFVCKSGNLYDAMIQQRHRDKLRKREK